ncbi:LOW QUALITY PROTEIN: protein misato [Culex quinquefasciatus]|uniref:LOW QUALITY PROTEIN: protein misato n=1 Tax=Culex quinquefasciatus TaxID=7176 RepID=UPI0018E385A4|nr:LOW QUALITY PROTEIN: protein misato [Culex quinquefasciatus]
MPREILTLQLGNYANYVGTHLWNLQESSFCYDPNAEAGEVDHDVLYREGRTANRQTTYTPRVLVVDLKGTLKFMPQEGTLRPEIPLDEEQMLENVVWESGRVEVVKEAKVEKNEFQKDLEVAGKSEEEEEEKDYNFKETVKDWIDFSYSRYHPRSIHIVNQYSHSKEENQFDTITNGMQLWHDFDFQDEFTDKIRQYLEECDGCQGFQTIMDCVDGFSGVGVKMLEHLQDEYGKASLVFPVIPPAILNFKNADKTMSSSVRVINTALAVSNLVECCSLFVPLSTMGRCWRDLDKPRTWSHLSYEQTNLYQTSAILATFLDTGSLRYRLKNPSSGGFLASLCSDLTPYGRKMAAAGLALPFPMNTSEDLIDFLDKSDQMCLHTQLTPNTTVGTNYLVQSVSIRGIPGNKLKRPSTAKSAQRQQRMAAYRCDSVSEMMQFYYQCQLHASMSHVTACRAPMEVRTPFPYELFDSRVGHDGFVTELDLGVNQATSSTPTLATLQNSGDLADTLDSLHREVSRIRIARIPRFVESGLELEDYKESLERLLDFKERYEDNYEL